MDKSFQENSSEPLFSFLQKMPPRCIEILIDVCQQYLQKVLTADEPVSEFLIHMSGNANKEELFPVLKILYEYQPFDYGGYCRGGNIGILLKPANQPKKVHKNFKDFYNTLTDIASETSASTNELPQQNTMYSDNFRSVTFSGAFTIQQARVLEFMYNQKESGRVVMHQKEILDFLNNGSDTGGPTKMQEVFKIRQDGKKILHPLFKEIFLYKKGFYSLKM